jgi:hypothetical protein
MKKTPDLSVAVGRLYDVFAGYRLPLSTDPCPCCHTPEDERLLHSKALTQLSASDLKKFAGDAILVWGNEDHYRHFLPRIFELMILAGDAGLELDDPQVVFARLTYGNWKQWPKSEQLAIQKYFSALWSAVLASTPRELCSTNVDDWLCGIAQAEDNLLAYLQTWSDDSTFAACLNLAWFIANTNFIQSDARPVDFWKQRKDQFQEVRSWVTGAGVKFKMDQAEKEWPREEMFGFARGVLR